MLLILDVALLYRMLGLDRRPEECRSIMMPIDPSDTSMNEGKEC
jgi:hypothetical protein